MFNQVLSARPQNVSNLLLSSLVGLLQVLVAESLQLKKLIGTALSELPIRVHDHSLRQHLVRGHLCFDKLVEELLHLPVDDQDLKSDFVGSMNQFFSLGHREL
jgi:hypothetical protein